MTESATQRTQVASWQRRLLPSELVESTAGGRSVLDWVVDVLVVGTAFLIGGLSLEASSQDHNGAAMVLDIVLGTFACLSLWVRRKHPIGVGVGAILVSTVSAFAGGAAIIAVFNAAVRSSRRALFGLVGLSIVAMAIFPLLYPSPGSWLGQFFFGVLLLAVAIGWGLFARARRELVYSLRERAERLESEQRLRVDQAREAERRRIAREMHDVLAHRLSLLSVHAGALEFRDDATPAEIGEAAGVIRSTAQSALDELRTVIGVLRDDSEDNIVQPPQPTLTDLPALVEESRSAGMRIELKMDVDGDPPAAVGRTAYRVVQEGLTNARKHAPGTAVDVTISTDHDELRVRVANKRSVTPRTSTSGSGAGLVGLGERVSLAGGELEHGPDEHGDFVLVARIPCSL